MLTPQPMELFSVAVLKDRIQVLVSRLVNLGIFHPVDIRRVEKELKDISVFQIESEYARCEALDARLDDIAKKTGVLILPLEELSTLEPSYEEMEKSLKDAQDKTDSLIEEKNSLSADIRAKEAALASIKPYDIPPYIASPYAYSFLKVEFGKIAPKDMHALEENLKNVPHVLYPLGREEGKIVALVIGLRKDRTVLEAALRDVFWQKIEMLKRPEGMTKDFENNIRIEIAECLKKSQAIDGRIKAMAVELKHELSRIRFFIALKKSLLEAKKHSFTTARTAVMAGWIPREDKAMLIKEVKKIDPHSYIETIRAENVKIPKEEIPVRLKNNIFFRPFELLINNYGIPRYGSVDPTVFIAMSFLLMFGAMFGDIGHGLAVALAGLFLIVKGKKAVMKHAGALALYCGSSASVFGILYGSFFGIEFHPLWIKPMESILTIFRTCLAFGMVMLSAGLILNIVNSLRDRDYLKLVYDKSGLIAGVIYWSGIALVSRFLVSKSALPRIYLYIIIGAVLLFLSHPVVEFILKKKRKDIAASFMEGIVDSLEILMLYLANTVSFIRIAAFALAHAGLFLSIFELAKLVKSTAGNTLVFVLGNMLVILLEGLVVSIQSLRLNYYEFFSKFFMTGKSAYKPLSPRPQVFMEGLARGNPKVCRRINL